VGVAATASYDLTDDVTFHLRGGWDRLIGDAADSPIVKEGSENQFYGGAGISYEFGFSLRDVHAFLEGDLPGKGTAASFTEEKTFLLLLGVLFLQSGLTQSRIVRLIKDIQVGLCRQYKWIVANPPKTRPEQSEVNSRKDLEGRGTAVAPVHLSYVVATGNLADPDGAVRCHLCRSNDQLVNAVADLSHPPRPLICLELSSLAWAVWHWLPQAPVNTRGRRPSSECTEPASK
jgi:hypothetical protein